MTPVLVTSDSLCLLPTVVNGVALGGVTLTLVVVTAQKWVVHWRLFRCIGTCWVVIAVGNCTRCLSAVDLQVVSPSPLCCLAPVGTLRRTDSPLIAP